LLLKLFLLLHLLLVSAKEGHNEGSGQGQSGVFPSQGKRAGRI